MKLAAVGINHKTAPLALREKASISTQAYPQHLGTLLALPALEEVMLLSTCNRTEIYARTDDLGALQRWFSQQLGVKHHAQLGESLYLHQNEAVISHALRVANGLDSMAIGEPQILGQLKQAYRIATQTGSLGEQLQRLFQYVFSASKQIRSLSNLSTHPISLAFIAVTLARRLFSNLTGSVAVILGTGQLSELVGHYLRDQGVQKIIVLARSTEKAKRLASQWAGEGYNLSDLSRVLPQADILVCATMSPLPLVGKGVVEQALKARKRKPILMIDLASPRDIEPQVKELEDIYLYNIDDLQSVITHNLQQRKESASQAETMIEAHVQYYMHRLRALNAQATIEKLRSQGETIREAALLKAHLALQRGVSSQVVITQLAHSLTNKLLHEPCVQLREAAAVHDMTLLSSAAQLFQLSVDD